MSEPSSAPEGTPEAAAPRRPLGARWAWLTLLLPALATLLALSSAPRPLPLPDATPAQAAQIARTARLREPALRKQAARKFAADPWSQADHFAHTEASLVRQLSGRLGVRPGAVLRAIDDDVRAHPDLPGRPPRERGQAPPCMPRVYYH